jgi:DNA polymerase-3 subunit beta
MTIEILPRSFATALKSVAYAMSTDTTKTWLNRILVECTGRELVLVATDGHRLAKAAIPMADEQDKWQATIPGANVSDLVKAVSAQAKGKGLLTVSKHRIESPAGQFEFDTAEMFPPYAQVIPQHSEVSVEYAESVELTTVTGALKTANKRLVVVEIGLRPPAIEAVIEHAELRVQPVRPFLNARSPFFLALASQPGFFKLLLLNGRIDLGRTEAHGAVPYVSRRRSSCSFREANPWT